MVGAGAEAVVVVVVEVGWSLANVWDEATAGTVKPVATAHTGA